MSRGANRLSASVNRLSCVPTGACPHRAAAPGHGGRAASKGERKAGDRCVALGQRQRVALPRAGLLAGEQPDHRHRRCERPAPGDGRVGHGQPGRLSFRTGRSFVMAISDPDPPDDRQPEWRTGSGTIPVSMGRPGFETRSGIKTIMSHERTVRMTSAKLRRRRLLQRDRARRGAGFADSGEYIHSAPWSVADQGIRNVSHGCVNVSPANARWLFTSTIVGDPVITTGTNRSVGPATAPAPIRTSRE